MRLRRLHARALKGVRFETTDPIRQRVKSILPFHPTAAQKRVLKEIVDDMKAAHPDESFDAGRCGKRKNNRRFRSVVIAVENGYQAAIMAPTEILAEQHYH